MAKSIKKSFKYFIIILGIIIMFPTFASLVLRIPRIQTLMVRRITGHLSEQMRSTISVGRFEYRFFNKLLLKDILIKDLNSDTLLYVERLSAGIKHIDLSKGSFTIGKLDVLNPVAGIITDQSGKNNLTWFLGLLSNPSDTLPKKKSLLRINEIEINKARISIINKTAPKGEGPIDFNNIRLQDVNAIIENVALRGDTTSFDIYNLGFREAGGFTVKRLNTSVHLSGNNYLLSSTQLTCDSSIINAPKISVSADSAGSFKKFTEQVRINSTFEKSLISFSDLKYFIPALGEMNESFGFSGKIFGTISELRGRNLEMNYGDHTSLSCDFDLSGLPEIKNSFIYLGINNFKTTAADIEKVKIRGKDPIILPDYFSKLGTISFDGSFTGFTTDFVTYGNISTRLGTIRTDISLRPEESKRFKVKGLITLSSIQLGEITGNPDVLGNVSMKTDVDGYATSFKHYNGQLTGKIDSIEINKYKYRDISLNGNVSEKAWDGSVNIAEKNIKMDLLGLFNFSEKLPEFDFTLNLAKANLYKLNFDKPDTTSSISMLLTANFKGSNIDNLDGVIKLLNSNIRKFGKTLDLYDFSIKTFVDNNKPAIALRTDFVDADLKGYYNFAGLGNVFRTTMACLMPSEFKPPVQKTEPVANNFTFKINFKKTDDLFSFFHTGIQLADKSTIEGSIFPDSIMMIRGQSKLLSVHGIVFNDLSLNADVKKPVLDARLTTSSLNLLGQSSLAGFNAELRTRPDTFNFGFRWDDHQKIPAKGAFVASGTFNRLNGEKAPPVLDIIIDSSSVSSNGNIWKIHNSDIAIDTSSFRFNNFLITNNSNFYHINGAVSKDPSDTLLLELRGIDISPLNSLVDKNPSPDQLSLSLKGNLNGKIRLTNVYYQPLLISNIKISGFSILQSDYGDVTLTSEWNSEKNQADIHAENNLGGMRNLVADGFYDPAAKKLYLNGQAARLPVDALNPLLKSFASGINGTATGKINLSGEPGKFVLKGALMLENAGLKIDYLQAKYHISDSIRFDKNSIIFKNVRATDEKGNPAFIDGTVKHNYFKDFAADLKLNTKNCMVLNTKPKDNDLFYGTAYASGLTTLKSEGDLISFDISAKTEKNTKFFIPLNSSETVSDYPFVTFLSKDTTSKKEPVIKPVSPVSSASGTMNLNFDLEVTPDAEFQLIFDPKVGDIMKGRGSADLSIKYDRQGNFTIFGDYIIEDGDYLFTLKNFLNKSFSVESGGKIIFNGDINNAGIDIKAIYKTRASLYELLGDEKFKEKIPVECQINLSGKLFNPVIGLDIYLPTADESTRTYVKNVITTEEELSRQFLYLLVTNHFYSDLTAGSSTFSSTTATGTSAMAVTTAEMVSNQLSNMLSKISNDFELGFVYRPGYKEVNSSEVALALSTQLLNDKVLINGNFDVTGTGNKTTNSDQLIGDFDIEYKITDKIRFKVFNRYNDPYTGKQAPYTQGMGFFYKEDFDKLSDIFRKKISNEGKKKDSKAAVK